MDNTRVMHMLHPLEVEVNQKGSTVRLGNKWQNARGDTVLLCVCSDRCVPDQAEECNDPEGQPCDNCERQGIGKVIYVWYGIFRDIPARLIEFEHERSSRRFLGLKSSMNKAYGDKFDEWAAVTALIYRRMG